MAGTGSSIRRKGPGAKTPMATGPSSFSWCGRPKAFPRCGRPDRNRHARGGFLSATLQPRKPAMKIRDVMTKDVHLARPADTIQDVSSRMAKGGFGFVPVADGDQLIGTITDRDIVVRALATGAASSASVVEFITRDPQTVLDTDDL